jgi:hypothetical protein
MVKMGMAQDFVFHGHLQLRFDFGEKPASIACPDCIDDESSLAAPQQTQDTPILSWISDDPSRTLS